MPDVSTMTVPRRSWRIRDAVIRLREHSTDRVYGLPVPPVACRMGTASDLQLQLHDPSGTVSREHAELVPVEVDGERLWKVQDLRSKNGDSGWCLPTPVSGASRSLVRGGTSMPMT